MWVFPTEAEEIIILPVTLLPAQKVREGEKKLEKEEKEKKTNAFFKSRRGFLSWKNLQHTFDRQVHISHGSAACLPSMGWATDQLPFCGGWTWW